MTAVEARSGRWEDQLALKPSPSDLGIDVSWTGDLPVRYVERAAKIEAKEADGVHRRAFERHDLAKDRVSARIWTKANGPPGVGWVANASVTGMWIETRASMPLRTQVQVELVVPGGYSTTISGRVIRANQKGMAIRLNTEDSSWQFRSSFIELALRDDRAAPSVIVRNGDVPEDDDTADLRSDDDFRVLGAKWHEVLGDLAQDAIHQEFIQECLKRQRLEFGLERYRELKDGPDDAVAAKYLAQIGIILGFMGLKKKNAGDKEKRARTAKLALACITVLGALLLAQELFLTKATITDPPATSEQAVVEIPPEDPPAPPPQIVAPDHDQIEARPPQPVEEARPVALERPRTWKLKRKKRTAAH